jgi:hypothetical protein
MNDLQSVFVTVQYLAAAALAFSIALYIIFKNPKSWAYRLFFLFGVSVGLWEVMMLLHRNAPTADPSLSLNFLISGIFFVYLAPGFLLAMLFMLYKERSLNLLVLAPAFIAGVLVVLFKPFDVVSTSFGWSLKATLMGSGLLIMSTWFWYVVGIIIAGWALSKKSKTTILKKKYTLIVSGFIIFYAIGFPISNILLFNNPEFPPIGGLFILSMFLVVAYAIYLPAEKIGKVSMLQKKYEKNPVPEEFPTIMYIFQRGSLSTSLKNFLEDFLKTMLGKELGQDLQEFDRFLNETGLNNAVFFKKGELVFDKDKLPLIDSLKSMDKILGYVKNKRLTPKAVSSLATLFLDVYKSIRTKSKIAADEWLCQILQKHRGFLSAHSFLSRLPSDIEPEQYKRVGHVLSSVRPGQIR